MLGAFECIEFVLLAVPLAVPRGEVFSNVLGERLWEEGDEVLVTLAFGRGCDTDVGGE